MFLNLFVLLIYSFTNENNFYNFNYLFNKLNLLVLIIVTMQVQNCKYFLNVSLL